MEDVYMKGFTGPREWCSEKVAIKPYFDEYSELLCNLGLTRKKRSEIEILNSILPKSRKLSDADLSELMDLTGSSRLVNVKEMDLEKKPKIHCQPVPSTSCSVETDTVSKISDGFKSRKNRLKGAKACVNKREVVLDSSEMSGRKDLIPLKNYLVSFRIHEPFYHKRMIKQRNRANRCMQQIWLLEHQTLAELKDKIVCEMDYHDARGDVSENPDAPMEMTTKELYPSSMFYFHNTCYIDKRKASHEDYSYNVIKWGKKNNIKFDQVQLMEETSVDKLELRFGYPYLFVHQGGCEHIIIVNDARLLSARDSLCSADYPLITTVTKHPVIHCMTCSRHKARWVVRDSDRMAHDPTFQCQNCFKSFNYINGKKVGNFRAYLYIQRNSL